MRILGDTWKEGFLDYGLTEGSVRLSPCVWIVVSDIQDVYFVREKRFRTVLNYIREFGVRATLHKVRSRLSEGLRNRRYLSVGIGRVVEAADKRSQHQPGDAVVFIAPLHPQCVERLVVDEALVSPVSDSLVDRIEQEGNVLWGAPEGLKFEAAERTAGWTPDSGTPIPHDIEGLLASVSDYLRTVDVEELTLLPKGPADVSTSDLSRTPQPGNIGAALYGYGNYAKTQIIPNIPRGIDLVRVHEVDPTQLEPSPKWSNNTSASYMSEDDCKVSYIAGFHHTHASIAIDTLNSGGVAVSEKPAITNKQQLEQLIEAVRNNPGRFYCCFHMRYNPLLRDIKEDLLLEDQTPVNYNCIVYEVPLPALHWYRWPNSGSHLISNGCHWLDHFMFLNGYPDIDFGDTTPFANGDTHVAVQAANGAVLSMQLTHAGSPRLGVRDHVELRTNKRTAVLESGAWYRVESADRIVKTAKGNRMDAYKNMYRTIGENIIAGRSGDSLRSIVSLNTLLLDLEDALKAKRDPRSFAARLASADQR